MTQQRKRRGKPKRIYTVKEGTTFQFSGVSRKFGLPLDLPKGVKVKRIPVDERASHAID